MKTADILDIRLHAQLIEGGSASSAHEVVRSLLGVQAQDYAGSTWAIGLRLPGSTLCDVERAIADRAIVRTWPMRGTLHFVTAEDVRWMLALLAPRVLARAARREQQLELDPATLARSRALFADALGDGRLVSRRDAMAMLEASGIMTGGQRGYHILWRLAQEGLLVVGPMEGKQQTFALLDEWVHAARDSAITSAPREDALAHLAARYFAGHGPATLDDLARWAGIAKSEARGALSAVADTLESGEHSGERYWFSPLAAEAACRDASGSIDNARHVHLLPGFDEYMLGYTGRSHQLGEHLAAYGSKVASNGMLAPTIISGGRAIGIWKRTLKARTVDFALSGFRPLTAPEGVAVSAEEARYARFTGREVSPVEDSG